MLTRAKSMYQEDKEPNERNDEILWDVPQRT